ncbi:MAG: hypothetical protein K2X38_13540 [Gemmataceae bacterium]|nr:hypothetical protein [Gemmataceae bacterium]
MWTSKRILLLFSGFALFVSGFAVYYYFLGGIDGLPPLPKDFANNTVVVLPPDGGGDIPPPRPPEIELKFGDAFGPQSEELTRSIRFNMHSKNALLAAEVATINEKGDGLVKLTPFSAAVFQKANDDRPFPEINTIQCETAIITMDRPITHIGEMSNRKVKRIELRGRHGVKLINNRGTPGKADDVEVHITGEPLFFEEGVEHDLVWTDGIVQLLDLSVKPHPTKVTAKGMDMHLTKEQDTPEAKANKKKGKKTGGEMELLILRSFVDMYLYIDADDGFLASPKEFAEGPKKDGAKNNGQKSKVVIKTDGPFRYEPMREFARFDIPKRGPAAPKTPDQILVTRENRVAGVSKFDQLVCDALSLQFKKKAEIPAKADPGKPPQDATKSKEIETALATASQGHSVVLTMETERLDAFCAELLYRAAGGNVGPQTILKGAPVLASKEGHRLKCREMHLIGPDKEGNGQQAFAKGPGEIDLYDPAKPKHNFYPVHAFWKDSLISTKDKDGDRTFDLLTLTGDASFVDDEQDQQLHGQRLQVWMEQVQVKDADKAPVDPKLAKKDPGKGSPRQRPHKVEAFEKVSGKGPDVIVRHANHLVICFKEMPAVEDMLPDPMPLAPMPPVVAGKDNVPPKLGDPIDGKKVAQDEKEKQKKPIEISANEIVSYVSTIGTKKELQELVSEGNVHVHQDPEDPKEKGIDIVGEMLNMLHHPMGKTLFVFGDARKAAQLQLGELTLIGPKVTINQKDNIAEVEGLGAMHMPSNASLDGKTVKKESRMTIHWNEGMIFTGGKFIDFRGGVLAYQDSASVKCKTMQVTLDKAVSFKEGQKGSQKAKVENVVCNEKAYILDAEKGPDGKYVKYHRMIATEVSMDNVENKVIAAGPNGRVDYLGMGDSDVGLAPKKDGNPIQQVGGDGAKGDVGKKKDKEVMKLTRVLFDGHMNTINRENGRTTRFLDNVEVFHVPSENPDEIVNPNAPPKDGFWMRSELLTIFGRKIDEKKQSQQMEAKRNVSFRTPEFYGNCDLLKFDEAQDMIIFEGEQGNIVTLYKTVGPAGAPPQKIQGSKILYNRRTGVFMLEGGKVISSWLLPQDRQVDTPFPAALMRAEGSRVAVLFLRRDGI